MKKFIGSISMCLVLALVLFTFFGIPAGAETIKGPDISVTVLPNENDENIFTVEIGFDKNPGVGAMTFTLLYDKDIFSTIAYSNARFYSVNAGLPKYLIVDHPESGYVSFVWAPEGDANLYTASGTFVRYEFKMNTKTPGLYKFSIANINPMLHGEDLSGCFANFNHDKYVPTVSNDTLLIRGDKDHPCYVHPFELSKKVEPNCNESGYSVYKCPDCGAIEKRDIKNALGHSYESVWTVDRIAEKGVTMQLSRHCLRCGDKKDITYLTLDDVRSLKIENRVGAKVKKTQSDELVKTDDGKGSGSETSKKPEGADAHNDLSEKYGIVDEIPDEENPETIQSAEEIIKTRKKSNAFYFGGVKLPKNSKTVGDRVAKTSVYLFGTRSEYGLLSVIINSFKEFFARLFS